jgi:hypothetical protein
MPPSDNSSHEEDVLLAFSVEPFHDRSTLERYLKEYPECSEALIDCALEFKLLPVETSPVWISDEKIEAGWQSFRSELGISMPSQAPNPFEKLVSSSIKNLVAQLNINSLLFTRIRDRTIKPSSIPHQFIQLLAKHLGESEENLSNYLSGPPLIASSSAFRASNNPTAETQIDFEEAVKTSHLSSEQEKLLLEMQD